MSGAQPLGVPFPDEEPARLAPQLRLVPDTLETLLTRVVADLRASSPDTTAAACRRDAIAVIEAGRAAGLLTTRKRLPAG